MMLGKDVVVVVVIVRVEPNVRVTRGVLTPLLNARYPFAMSDRTKRTESPIRTAFFLNGDPLTIDSSNSAF
jgi:hypothetical protein